MDKQIMIKKENQPKKRLAQPLLHLQSSLLNLYLLNHSLAPSRPYTYALPANFATSFFADESRISFQQLLVQQAIVLEKNEVDAFPESHIAHRYHTEGNNKENSEDQHQTGDDQ